MPQQETALEVNGEAVSREQFQIDLEKLKDQLPQNVDYVVAVNYSESEIRGELGEYLTSPVGYLDVERKNGKNSGVLIQEENLHQIDPESILVVGIVNSPELEKVANLLENPYSSFSGSSRSHNVRTTSVYLSGEEFEPDTYGKAI